MQTPNVPSSETLTLAQWLEGWPYRGRQFGEYSFAVPDSAHDERYRSQAWRLSDYLVSSVSGGSIWFFPRVNG